MFKKIIILLSLAFFVLSCETMSSVKRALTGEKLESTDEFFVRKKDPLSQPPNFNELPAPNQKDEKKIESSNIADKLKEKILTEENNSVSSSTEESILKKIRRR
tara:strand:- start:397 stop:708 length:312 start_codon:yes stop_codon:yes gene_type:complete